MNSDEHASQNMEWGPWIIVIVGALLFLLGAGRFVGRHHFGFIDVLHCCLAVLAAGLLLLVFDYVLHHALLVSVIPLGAAGMLVFSSPAFDVALGVSLMVAVLGPAWMEWKGEQRLRKSRTAHGDEKDERK